ncbi:MAG: carbohydrate kinase [Candidatus Ratteibacteria bacterium]
MKAISFGAILWDVIEGKKYLGGAPFNFAAHLSKLGAESYMISRIGRDKLGEEAVKIAQKLRVNISLVQVDPVHPTGTVKVAVESNGLPSYHINEDAAYDYIEINDGMLTELKKTDAEVFYFGTLEQRSEVTRNTLYRLLESLKFKYIFYDVNLRQNYYSREILKKSLSHTNILKLNSEEMEQLSNLIYGQELSEKDFFHRITNNYPLKTICLTKGGKGCLVYSEGRMKEITGKHVKVIDTVGAGDAFSAAFIHKYLQNNDPFEAAEFANQVGGYVASRRGAIPEYNNEIKSLFSG